MKKVVLFIAFVLLNSFVWSVSAATQLTDLYAQAELLMVNEQYEEAAACFDKLGAYSDASKMAMYCKALAAAEKHGMYSVAVETFENLGDFKDSNQLALYYKGREYEMEGDTYCDAESDPSDSQLQYADQMYDKAKSFYSQQMLFKDIMSRIAACDEKKAIIQSALVANDEARKESIYIRALAAENEGNYEDAAYLFQQIVDYKDSKDRISAFELGRKKTAYDEGKKLLESKMWNEAIRAFQEAGDYEDARELVLEIKYQMAMQLVGEGKIAEAVSIYKTLGDYKDSVSLMRGLLQTDISYYNVIDLDRDPHLYEILRKGKTSYTSENDGVYFDPAKLQWQGNRIMLSEDDWNQIQDVKMNLFFRCSEGFMNMGVDLVCSILENNLYYDHDGTWISIDRQPISFWPIANWKTDQSFLERYYTPVYLNGERTNLIIEFSDEVPYGHIVGAEDLISESKNLNMDLEKLTPVNAGDTIQFVCNLITEDDVMEIELGSPVIAHTDIEIGWTYISYDAAVILYRFIDANGNRYWTPMY